MFTSSGRSCIGAGRITCNCAARTDVSSLVACRRANPVRTIVRIAVMAIAACSVASARGVVAPLDTQADLNTFMKEVLERRDENWKKLQQYILDENEKI